MGEHAMRFGHSLHLQHAPFGRSTVGLVGGYHGVRRIDRVLANQVHQIHGDRRQQTYPVIGIKLVKYETLQVQTALKLRAQTVTGGTITVLERYPSRCTVSVLLLPSPPAHTRATIGCWSRVHSARQVQIVHNDDSIDHARAMREY